jgi:sensor histidine kinase YesM
VDADKELAQDAILRLSALMRYLLYESGRGTTTLSKEIEFLRSYVNLMQLRVDESVSINLELPGNIEEINLPPLLFISFIENAFKHGVSYRERSSLSFSLRQFDHSLEFISSNTISAFNDQNPSNNQGGIGLENTRKRLQLLYGENYKLDITNNDKEFRVRLIIPV